MITGLLTILLPTVASAVDFERVDLLLDWAVVHDVATADLDGDGDRDVLIAGEGAPVAWGENNGTLEDWEPWFVDDVAATHVAAGDLDGDGHLDVVMNDTATSRVVWVRRNPAGHYEPTRTIGRARNVGPLVVVDADGDGDLDVVAAGAAVALYENVGGGSFALPVALDPGPVAVADVQSGDLDGDGDPDLVASYATSVEVFENVGGAFVRASVAAGLGGPHGLALHDLDGDGDLDVACADPVLEQVLAFENLGALAFATAVVDAAAGPVTAIGAGDLDGDAIPDLTVTDDVDLNAYFGVGGGAFAPPTFVENLSLSPVSDPVPLALADMDGDGDLDVLTQHSTIGPDGPVMTPWLLDNDGFGGMLVFWVLDESTDTIDDWVLGDIDGDGDLDRVVTSVVRAFANLQLEPGVLWGETELVSLPGTLSRLALLDVDTDGDLDLVTSGLDRGVYWFANLGGTFGASTLVDTLTDNADELQVVDVDGDGVDDLVLRHQDYGMRWYRVNGAGFDPAVDLLSVTLASSDSVATDLDGDGDPDFAIGSEAWVENAGGSFVEHAMPLNIPLPQDVMQLAAGDLDGDGDPDLVGALGSDGVNVWEHLGAGSVLFGPADGYLPQDYERNWAALDVQDIDLDGDLDILAVTGNTANLDFFLLDPDLRWLVNQGGMTFEPRIVSQRDTSERIQAVDLDADGWPDLVTSRAWYRNKLWSDLDRDGLTLAEEIAAGSSETDRDSDDDGVPDEREVMEGTDPSRTDTDLDGLSDDAELLAGTDPLAQDTDGDGASDGSEQALGHDPLDPADTPALLDSDGDGLLDAEEALLGTDPLLADTDAGGTTDGIEHVIDGTSPLDPGDDYPDHDGDGVSSFAERLSGSDFRATDSDGDGLDDGVEVLVTRTDPSATDTDGDGLDDGREVLLIGSDVLEPDTDGGGIPDGAEVDVVGTDVLDAADDGVDSDVDGLPDTTETALGTDPLLWDTDGDGLSDGEEAAAHHTDPLLVDTDGDGLDDWDEVVDPVLGDARVADTDGDRWLDLDEGLEGTDPHDPADVPPPREWLQGNFLETGYFTKPFDVDLDGDLDLVGLVDDGTGLDDVSVVENLGGGAYAAPVISVIGEDLAKLKLGDFDSDGFPDLLSVNNHVVYVLLNDGTGAFSLSQTLAAGAGVFMGGSFGVADVDADGDDDAVIWESFALEVWYFPQVGGALVGPPLTIATGCGGDIVPADLDGDGDQDLVVSASTVEGCAIENLGGGAFGAPVLLGWRSFTVADVDGDGDTDLGFDSGSDDNVGWLENLGGFTFAEHLVAAGSHDGVLVADLDGVSGPDLIAAESFEVAPFEAVVWWPQIGPGVFGPKLTIHRDYAPVDTIDYDADGDLDVLTSAGGASPGVLVAWNDVQEDDDADGLLNVDEGVHESDPTRADGDADGLLDIDEIALGTRPSVPDSDGGGVPDGVEVVDGTNPRKPGDDFQDTDGDGLSDTDELLVHGTDPLAFDTDGDLASDGDEVLLLLTDPLDRDTDGDGWRDGIEVRDGGDPLDPAVTP